MGAFTTGARGFGKAIWDVLGERKNPRIVFEHPGQDTIPTSIFVADNGGNWFLSGAPHPRWPDDQINTLKRVKGRDFEVVRMGTVATE